MIWRQAHKRILVAPAGLFIVLWAIPLKTDSMVLNPIKIPLMADFNKIVPFLFHWEGGYSNDPADKGNFTGGKLIGTKYGVSAPCLRDYLGRMPTVEEMQELTKDTALKIMKGMFWDVIKGDDIEDQSVANFICDWVYNSGAGVIDNIQRVVGVDDDGKIGKQTVTMINSWDGSALFEKLKSARISFLLQVVARDVSKYLEKHPNATDKELNRNTKLKFKRGWLNRVNAMEYD